MKTFCPLVRCSCCRCLRSSCYIFRPLFTAAHTALLRLKHTHGIRQGSQLIPQSLGLIAELTLSISGGAKRRPLPAVVRRHEPVLF